MIKFQMSLHFRISFLKYFNYFELSVCTHSHSFETRIVFIEWQVIWILNMDDISIGFPKSNLKLLYTKGSLFKVLISNWIKFDKHISSQLYELSFKLYDLTFESKSNNDLFSITENISKVCWQVNNLDQWTYGNPSQIWWHELSIACKNDGNQCCCCCCCFL